MSPASIRPAERPVTERTPPKSNGQEAEVPADSTPGAPSAGRVAAGPSGKRTAASPSQSASPDADQAQAPTRLTLQTAVGSGPPRTVSLQCDPAAGTHPKAAQACADLAKARGDFVVAADDKNPRACFMIYSPVVISAEGQWRGEAVKFTSRYPNTCVLRAKTGSIFDF